MVNNSFFAEQSKKILYLILTLALVGYLLLYFIVIKKDTQLSYEDYRVWLSISVTRVMLISLITYFYLENANNLDVSSNKKISYSFTVCVFTQFLCSLTDIFQLTVLGNLDPESQLSYLVFFFYFSLTFQ